MSQALESSLNQILSEGKQSGEENEVTGKKEPPRIFKEGSAEARRLPIFSKEQIQLIEYHLEENMANDDDFIEFTYANCKILATVEEWRKHYETEALEGEEEWVDEEFRYRMSLNNTSGKQ